jgi:glycosyltransferase involved in cell wall biosynthesis
VGRVAIEKNLPAFLGLGSSGHQARGGRRPAARIAERFRRVFVGTRTGPELASYYQRADVRVPSRTDTLGLVLAEAMACGTPVAVPPVRVRSTS